MASRVPACGTSLRLEEVRIADTFNIPWWPEMIGLTKATCVHFQMLKRSLYQPFLRPLHQALWRDVRRMERRAPRADMGLRGWAKALRPQVQELADRQHVGGFAQAHCWSLPQRARHPAEDAQHHHQPRYGPMLGPLFTEAEHLTSFARVAVASTTVSALTEGGINMGGGRR